MTALVTGGNGFLGGAIVRVLRARGDSVRSFSRHSDPRLTEIGVEQFTGNLADATAVSRAVAGCDIVYHVAAKAGVWGRYRDYFATNVTGSVNVLNACRQHGVRKLVYTSSPSVIYHGGDLEGVDESIPDPKHFEAYYPETKAIAEKQVLEANGPDLATVALRPHLIWGPGDPHLIPRLIDRAKRGKLRRIGSGNPKVDVIYIDNAAHAHVLAGDRLAAGQACAGKAYFLSQGEPVVLWDFLNSILQIVGLEPVRRRVPFWLAWFAGATLETAYRTLFLKSEPPMTRFVARQLASSHWFNIAAARRDLGYEPIVSTDEGLRRLAAAFSDPKA
ncbi:MAG: NAD-dependent epimerase/dehydratase family protein [Planctomycetes bacterium]|nr:NAD-dependent epimerase/dehydratase family protein [Planctomycetota bacterium]